jgi:polysaccharide chain length determinant protein (PEP-CTERM system associated)
LLEGLAIETDFNSIVQLMVRKLLSRPNLERAIKSVNIDLEGKTPKQRERFISYVRDQIEISASQRTGTYIISYEDSNRERAKLMVETLLDIFVEDTLGKSTVESDSAIDFLNQQIEKYDHLLQEAEERREQFKRKNVGLMPGDGQNYYTQLQQVDAQLETIVTALNEATSRRDQLVLKLAELGNPVVVNTAPAKSSYDQRIIEQEAKLNDLLLLYTDEHPDVINARMILDTLQARRDQEIINIEPQTAVEMSNNPVYQQIQILLAQTEAEISSLRSRRSSFAAKKRELRKQVEIVPRIEAELQRLNRDYEVHRRNYTELVQRREKARISEDVETGTEQVKFRIIEPPFVPLSPSFPNRKVLDVMILSLALGCGYGISLLISLLKPVYSSSAEMRRLVNYPVLGSIGIFETRKMLFSRRRNLILFAGANLSIVVIAGIFVFMHHQEMLIIKSVRLWMS